MDDEALKELLDSMKDAFAKVVKGADSTISLMATLRMYSSTLEDMIDKLKEHLELY